MTSESVSTIGWREWVILPRFSSSAIKAKIDTGAKTSSLHARDLELVEGDDGTVARFRLEPEDGSTDDTSVVTAPVVDYRTVKSSNGQSQTRPVVRTEIEVGDDVFVLDLTLADRGSMRHRILLGRRALEDRYRVDAGRSYLLSDAPPGWQET
jgi:hypothetical protein